jgi:FADH2 O2-dependent halogenase
MPGWKRLLERLPSVQKQFAEATAELPFVHTSSLSFRSRDITGRSWALLPSSAGFVDPLLSTGFPLTLLGVTRLANTIEKDWGTDRFEEQVNAYARQTVLELAAAEELVAALYTTMSDFSVFVPLSLLYFAAASFSEAARRLGRAELARSFLLRNHSVFGPEIHACCSTALHGFSGGSFTNAQKDSLIARIGSTIEPFDIAGLNDKNRRNWYPVDGRDILAAAPKLGATELEAKELLRRSGFVHP